jgi:phosphate transport system substrate-binding protein
MIMHFRLFFFIVVISIVSISCGGNEMAVKKVDTAESGVIRISADESFRPVIDAQIHAYELNYPQAHIIAEYKSEASCFRDFFHDSANRMVIVSRGLNRNEEKYMIDSLNYNPACQPVASDAVAIIVNINQPDTLYTLNSLQQLLQGKLINKIAVFDGLNATSTVRFITDSILKGKSFDEKSVKAAKNTKEVIDYVANHEEAIGFVGISWVGNPEDSTQLNVLRKVKIAYVRCDQCQYQPYVKPMQQNMLTKRYPLVRNLFYILKENYSGLGTGFASFLKFERGQLVFRRAYLGPVMDLDIRSVRINESLPKNKD